MSAALPVQWPDRVDLLPPYPPGAGGMRCRPNRVGEVNLPQVPA